MRRGPARDTRHLLSRSAAAVLAGVTIGGLARGAEPANPVAPPWSRVEAVPGGAVAVRASAQSAPERVVRFAVAPGASPVESGERAELVATPYATYGFAGETVRYDWRTFFPRSFRPVARSTWNIFTQWHETATDHCHPNLALQVNTIVQPARLRVTARGGDLRPGCLPQSTRIWDLAPLVRGRWLHFTLTAHWSPTSDGWIRLAIDGRRVLARKSVPDLYTGQGVYLKQGFYRAPAPFVSTLFHGGMQIAPVTAGTPSAAP